MWFHWFIAQSKVNTALAVIDKKKQCYIILLIFKNYVILKRNKNDTDKDILKKWIFL